MKEIIEFDLDEGRMDYLDDMIDVFSKDGCEMVDILFDRFLKKYYADIDVSNKRMTINLTDEEGHVVALTGYTLTTVHNWCSRGSLKAFQKGLKFCIPKIFLVDFFCSLTFRSITRKSLWHIQTLNEFSRKMKRK